MPSAEVPVVVVISAGQGPEARATLMAARPASPESNVPFDRKPPEPSGRHPCGAIVSVSPACGRGHWSSQTRPDTEATVLPEVVGEVPLPGGAGSVHPAKTRLTARTTASGIDRMLFIIQSFAHEPWRSTRA